MSDRNTLLVGFFRAVTRAIALVSLTAVPVVGGASALPLPDSGRACISCHGPETGMPTAGIYPKLYGQHAAYTFKQLRDMKEGVTRKNAMMDAFLRGMTPEEMQKLANYFASKPPVYGVATNKERAEVGRQIYQAGIPERGVPSCAGCHGPAGLGMAAAKFPLLAGQNPEYLVSSLKAFKNRSRTNGPNRMMSLVTDNMTPQDMDAVAEYIVGLRPRDKVSAE